MTWDEYFEQQKGVLNPQFEETAERKKQNKDDNYAQISAAIDQSADTAAGVYQRRMDDADLVFKSQYTDNAINEAFTREQIKNSMAASGMTDSGQNLTMQTAVGLQRQRQDNAVTEKKRDYVKELQDAIDEVRVNAANEKKAQQLSLDQQYQDWYDQAFLEMEQTAADNASTLWSAEQDRLAQEYAAEQDRLAREAEAQAEYEAVVAEAGYDAASKANESRQKMISSMMAEGNSYEHAVMAAYAAYPTGDATTDAKAAYYMDGKGKGYTDEQAGLYASTCIANGGDTQAGVKAVEEEWVNVALDFADSFYMKINGGIETFFGTASADGELAAEKVLKEMSSHSKYSALSPEQQKIALATAVGKTIAYSWPSKEDGTKNKKRMEAAAEKLGLPFDYVKAAYIAVYGYNGLS